MKKVLPWILVIGMVLLSLMFLDRACRADAKLKQAESDYAAAKREAEAAQQVSADKIIDLTKQIGERDQRIEGLEKTIYKDSREIGRLERELAAAQAEEPPTTPEIEAMPIVINLRAQVGKLTELYGKARSIIDTQDQEISELKSKYTLQTQISDEWKAAYEREHLLRVQAEDLFKIAAHRLKLNKTEKWVYRGLAAGGVAYGLLK